MPRFFLVARAETQSLNGPAVASPINAPIKIAKFMKPMLCELYPYGGTAKATLWVRFNVRKELQDQETTKAENSTIGKAKSFHGTQMSINIVFKGLALGVYRPHCALLGVPFPRKGSRSAVAVWDKSGIVPWVGTCSIFPPRCPGSSTASVACPFSEYVGGVEVLASACMFFITSSGCKRCHFVSGTA